MSPGQRGAQTCSRRWEVLISITEEPANSWWRNSPQNHNDSAKMLGINPDILSPPCKRPMSPQSPPTPKQCHSCASSPRYRKRTHSPLCVGQDPHILTLSNRDHRRVPCLPPQLDAGLTHQLSHPIPNTGSPLSHPAALSWHRKDPGSPNPCPAPHILPGWGRPALKCCPPPGRPAPRPPVLWRPCPALTEAAPGAQAEPGGGEDSRTRARSRAVNAGGHGERACPDQATPHKGRTTSRRWGEGRAPPGRGAPEYPSPQGRRPGPPAGWEPRGPSTLVAKRRSRGGGRGAQPPAMRLPPQRGVGSRWSLPTAATTTIAVEGNRKWRLNTAPGVLASAQGGWCEAARQAARGGASASPAAPTVRRR